jgi:glycosyltransferase involved in cell wall biosynthesis
VQDIWPDSAIVTLGIRNRLVIRMLEALCGWIYRQADRVLVQSDGFHDSIARYGVPRDRIATLPNCAPELFESAPDPEVPAHIRAIVPQDRPVIMFAGNIGDSQDFETIVEAAALLPDDSDLLIVVVGSGRAEVRVRALIAQRGLGHRFLFLGRHPEAEMPAFFACADAMLVSLKDEPIFALTIPSKVQAYLACGKPVVASLAGEGGSVVARSGAGIVAPPSDPEALSRALLDMARTPDAGLRSMGRAAREFYDANFSLATVTQALEGHLVAVMSALSTRSRISSRR